MWCNWMPLTFPTWDWHVQCMRKLSVKLWGFWLLEVAFGCDNTCAVLACSGEHKRSPRNPVTGSETKSIKEHRAASKSRREWVEVLAKMYVHGHQNASEVLASMINLKPLTPPPVHMFLFPNVPICLDVLTTHGNPTSLVFEHYHCAKGEHPGSTKPIDTRNPSVFCGKTPLYSNWLYVGSKKIERVYLDRLHCTALCYTRLPLSLSFGRKHLEDLPRWLEVSQSSWVSRGVREISSETNTLSWSWTASSGWVLISLGCSPQDSTGTHRFPWNLERQFQCSKSSKRTLQTRETPGAFGLWILGCVWNRNPLDMFGSILCRKWREMKLRSSGSMFPTMFLRNSDILRQGSIPKPLIVAVADNNPDLVGAVGPGNFVKTWQDVPIGTLLEPYWNPIGT